MSTRIPGFKGEYVWELDIAEHQLLRLAEAFPADRYGWRPADSARSVGEVLVHVAAGNLMLLGTLGIEAAPDIYGKIETGMAPRMMAMIATNDSLEKSVRDKADVMRLFKRSLEAVRTAFTDAPDTELERMDMLFGEQTTVRRVYLRMLTHMHEHMGQLIGYTRAMGMPAPWPNWREAGKKMVESGQTA
jgi:uncharacterized damage-inducible protein DinB